MSTITPDATHTPAVANPNLAAIDNELAALEAKREELLRKREEEANSKIRLQNEKVEETMAFLGLASKEDFIRWLRNSGVSSPKAKRLTDLAQRQLKHVLSRGATIAATAKFFKLSEATVNTRKKQFGLVGRKNIKPVPFSQAMKGMPTA
jgi:hypothetical protein